MAHDAQLDWEARAGKAAAGAALVYGVLSVVGTVYPSSALPSNPDDARGPDGPLDSDSNVFVTTAAIQSAWPSYRRARAPLSLPGGEVQARGAPRLARVFAIAGPIILAIAGVLVALDRIDSAEEFLASGPQTKDRAEDLLRESAPLTLGFGLGGALALATAYVAINLNAMRAGILSRFMGILGVIVGALLSSGSCCPWVVPACSSCSGWWPWHSSSSTSGPAVAARRGRRERRFRGLRPPTSARRRPPRRRRSLPPRIRGRRSRRPGAGPLAQAQAQEAPLAP